MRIAICILVGVCLLGGGASRAGNSGLQKVKPTVIATSSEGSLRMLNVRSMTIDGNEKVFGISSARAATIRLTAAGAHALSRRTFRVRLFRSDPELGRPRAIGVDDDGCEVYYSGLLDKDIAGDDLIIAKFNEYWLARRGERLGDETYVLMLEDGDDQNAIIKLRPGLADTYFKFGFKLIVTRDRQLSRQDIERVLQWAKNGPNYERFRKQARCVDSEHLVTARGDDDEVDKILVAVLSNCNA